MSCSNSNFKRWWKRIFRISFTTCFKIAHIRVTYKFIFRKVKPLVQKKAALALLRLYRKYPEILPPDTWSSKVVGLLNESNLGVLSSVSSLIIGLVANNPKEYEECVQKAIKILSNVIFLII
jgi:hypothetical protein